MEGVAEFIVVGAYNCDFSLLERPGSREQELVFILLPPFLLFIQYKIPAHGMVLPIFRAFSTIQSSFLC